MWSQRKHKQAAGAQPFPGEPSRRMERRWRKGANEMQIWGISKEQEPQIEEENVEESKWVSAIQRRLCHHLQGERILCLPPLIAWFRCQFYSGCLDAWACGSSCHVVATSIHASTCHVDLSSTPGVCASTASLNVEFWKHTTMSQRMCAPLQGSGLYIYDADEGNHLFNYIYITLPKKEEKPIYSRVVDCLMPSAVE